ncbi:MAG: hypothetical protein SGPRY_000496 [Prymnesium sp.]
MVWADGRFLAARAARESDDGFVELGLIHPGLLADVCHWVKVSADETLSSLVMDTITHLWLGFFNGPAETPEGRCMTREPDGGSVELGIRLVVVELEAEAGSSRLRGGDAVGDESATITPSLCRPRAEHGGRVRSTDLAPCGEAATSADEPSTLGAGRAGEGRGLTRPATERVVEGRWATCDTQSASRVGGHILDGGWQHEVLAPEVFSELLRRAQYRASDVAAFEAGATYVVENPIDRGKRGSASTFANAFQNTDPSCCCQRCVRGGDCDHRAERLPRRVPKAYYADGGGASSASIVGVVVGPQCTHQQHARRAQGKSSDGSSEVARGAAYPPVFNAAMVDLLFASADVSGETLRAARSTPALHTERDGCRPARGTAVRHTAGVRTDVVGRPRSDALDVAGEHQQADGTPVYPRSAGVCGHQLAPEPPVTIEQLFMPGVYADLLQTVKEVAASLWRQRRRGCLEERRRAWCQAVCQRCIQQRRVSAGVGAVEGVGLLRSDGLQLGKRLSWPDEDMLYRATREGGTSRSTCARDTVIHMHHLGLRLHYDVARASVDADTAESWITEGTHHLRFVPSRLVPKNVVSEAKRLGADRGDDIGNVCRCPARVVVIVQATTCQWGGVHIPSEMLQHVAVWALDLTIAPTGGLDKRCEFGSAHLVDLFQRISSFVMAVARERIRQYDVTNPYVGWCAAPVTAAAREAGGQREMHLRWRVALNSSRMRLAKPDQAFGEFAIVREPDAAASRFLFSAEMRDDATRRLLQQRYFRAAPGDAISDHDGQYSSAP